MKSGDVQQVDCPTCHTPVIWQSSSQFRPFCSERCKLLDLGDWAAQKHRIAGDPIYPDVDEESDSVW